jgi:hypothetical protein
MIDSLINLLFRCRHRRLTRPLTATNASGVPEGMAYVSCLDCGTRIAYDTKTMKMGKAIRPEPVRTTPKQH